MTEELLLNISPQETRVALVAGGAVQELHIERTLERGLVGNIYLGKVARVLPGMQSAFIDIGLERAAFLHVADLWSPALIGNGHGEGESAAATSRERQPIEKLVFEGQTLVVQVVKDPIGSKGARLSTQMSLAGRLLVHLPFEDHVGVSQRIDPQARESLRARVGALARAAAGAPPAAGGTGGGYIIRTNAEEASDEEFAEDIAYLRKTWASIRAQAQRVAAPALLYQDLSLAQRVLRDLVGDDTRAILVDSRENFDKLCAFAAEFTPRVRDRIQLYRGERPLFDNANVDAEIERALARRVDLKSGGYLIIDQTEALTTIDVNTGGYIGSRNFDDTIFRTNLEATLAIARQLRMRNLGGIIIIDFIDMASAEHRSAVLEELKRQLARDRTKTTVNGFTQLGLVEMTRKRTRESLAHRLCEPCPMCQGKGEVKTPRTVCYEILREILREAKQFNPREFRIVASQNVIDLFLDDESQHLAGLSDFIGKPISLRVETAFHQEQYDIVLL